MTTEQRTCSAVRRSHLWYFVHDIPHAVAITGC